MADKDIESIKEQLKGLREVQKIKELLIGLDAEQLKNINKVSSLTTEVREELSEQLLTMERLRDTISESEALHKKFVESIRDGAKAEANSFNILKDKYKAIQEGTKSKTIQLDMSRRMLELDKVAADLNKENAKLQNDTAAKKLIDLAKEIEERKQNNENVDELQKQFEDLNIEQIKLTDGVRDFGLEAEIADKALKAIKRTTEGIDGATLKANDAILTRLGLLNTKADTLDNIAISLGRDGIGALPKMLMASVNSFDLLNMSSAKLNKGISTIVNKMYEMAMAIDSAESGFRRLTGGGGAMEGADKDIRALVESTSQFGGNAAIIGKAYGDLFTTFTDFSFVTQAQRKELGENATMLKQYGVETKTFATIIQNQTKILGQSTTEAAAFARELTAFAQDIGMAPGMISEQFASLQPQISKVRNMETAFKDLARVSKITGLEMTKILQITDQFDTFEGAASQVGKLNALLGGDFVNAIDLMMMESPADRFNAIADSITNAGLSFDSMSYYQKLAYTEAMGLKDVGELALVLSGNTEKLSGMTQQTSDDYIKQAEAAAHLASVQEKLNAMLATAAAPGGPVMMLVDQLSTLLGFFLEYPGAIKAVLPTLVLFRGITMLAGLAQAFTNIQTAIASKRFRAMALAIGAVATILFLTRMNPPNFLVGIVVLGTAFLVLSKMLDKSSKSFYKAAPAIAAVMLSLAGAFLAMSMFVDSLTGMGEMLNTLSGEAMNAFIMSLGILAVGMIAVIAVVGILVYSGLGLAAAGVFLAIGAAVLMAGGGMSLFGLGIQMIANSFGTLMDAIDFAKMAALTLFIYSIAPLALFLPSIMFGFGGLATALMGFSVALALVPGAKLQAISSLVASIASAEASKLTAVADSFREIANAIDEIPTTKAMALSATMATTALASTVVNTTATRNITERIASAATRTAGAAAGGSGGGTRTVKRQDVFVNFNMGETVFRKKVITIVGEAFDLEQD